MLVSILDAAHKAELVVGVGGERHAVDLGHFSRLGCQSRRDAGHEAAFLLFIGHGVHVVRRHRVSFAVLDRGIHHQEVLVGVRQHDVADRPEVEARTDKHIIIADQSFNRRDQFRHVGFLDVLHGAVRVVRDEIRNAEITVLVEVSVVHAAGGHDQDLQGLSVRSRGSSRKADQKRQCTYQSNQFFHFQFPPVKTFWGWLYYTIFRK